MAQKEQGRLRSVGVRHQADLWLWAAHQDKSCGRMSPQRWKDRSVTTAQAAQMRTKVARLNRDCRAIGGQAAMASSEAGSTAWNSWLKLEPSLPLKPAQRTWSRRSAPRRDHRICWDLFMRRLTRKLAVPSVSDVPTRRPARWRSA